jgi:hypothetical protein
MASTYVNDLRLNEMATGDASGSWGTVTNTNLELIGEAFSYGTETIGDADSTLTIADGAADAARSFYLKITSSVDLTTTRIVTLGPNTVSKVWMIENATTGSQVITIKQGSGATINVPNGQVKMLATDGAGSGGAVLDLLVDVDLTGTTTLVNLDVSGAVDIAGDLTLSAGGDGALRFTAASSVKVLDNDAAALVFEEADNAYMTFVTTDGSEAVKFDKALDINAATQIDATVTVGIDDTGYDVKFFGATAGAYMLWDESADDLILGGAAGLTVAGDIDVDGTTNLDIVDVDGAVNFAADVTFADGADIITASAGTSNFRAGVNAGNSIESGGNYNTVVGDEAGTAITTGDGNTAVGYNSLVANTTANYNTAVGRDSLATNTSGTQNTAVGRQAMLDNTVGYHNTGLGSGALANNIEGNQNTAVGKSALFTNTTASNNTAVGTSALLENTTGATNVAVGVSALQENTTASNNTALGQGALAANTTASNNTAVGFQAGYANTTGSGIVAVGRTALLSNTTGSANTGVGTNALQSTTSGNYNTALGQGSLETNTTADNNTAVGYQAAYANTTGANNTAVGHVALAANTTGLNNTAIGREALLANTTGQDNTAVGYNAGAAVTTGIQNTLIGGLAGDALIAAADNVAVGFEALSTETGGQNNVAIGPRALKVQVNASGNIYNTAVGSNAATATTTGNLNTAIGGNALYSNTTASNNTAVGYQAGYSNTTGIQNLFVGSDAGYANTTGSGNTYVGRGDSVAAGVLMTTGSKNTIIGGYSGNQGGLDIRTASNHIVLSDGDGNARMDTDASGVSSFRSSIDRCVGVNNGTYTWFMGTNGSNQMTFYDGAGTLRGYLTLGGTWTDTSDLAFKTNITDLSYGLAEVERLQPRSYFMKETPDSDPQIGFIAQEVELVIPEVVSGEEGSKGIGYGRLTAILVKAIQEQQATITALTARITALEGA